MEKHTERHPAGVNAAPGSALSAEADRAGTAASHERARARRVLVIHQDSETRAALVGLIKAERCQVAAAATAGDTDLASTDAWYDLAVVDCEVPCTPRCHGIAQELRASGRVRTIVGLTAALPAAWGGDEGPCEQRPDRQINRDDVHEMLGAVQAFDDQMTSPRGASMKPAPFSKIGGSNLIPAQYLLWTAGIDTRTAARVMELFVADTRQRLQRIEQCLELGHLEGAIHEVHALKSGAMQVGAGAITAACVLLTAALTAGLPMWSRSALDRLEEAFAASRWLIPLNEDNDPPPDWPRRQPSA